jgi:uncharacterized protein (DUF58 family)
MLPATFTPQYLRQLELFKLHSRRAFLGTRQGGHVSLKRGHGIEFSDYRQYELGDNPRHIDWGVYARSDRLYVKRFQEEQDLSVLILIDSSASMFTPAADKKWEQSRDIALSLAYVALLAQDNVMLAVPDAFYSPRYTGAGAIHQLGRALLELKLDGGRDFISNTPRAVSALRFPGVAVVLSDFLMPLEDIMRLFNMLRAKNLDITAIQVLGPNDLDPLRGMQEAFVVDSESGRELDLVLDGNMREGYQVVLEQHIKKLRTYFAEARIAFTQVDSNKGLSAVLVEHLSQIGLLQ